jgi:putative FmdB family regulatory protein
MPIYEYRCSKCRKVYEVLQKAKDRPLRRCPECRGLMDKLVSPPAIQFKGNGWYVTDYARKGAAPPSAKPETEAGTKAEPKPDSGAKGKHDKPAA